MFIRMIFSLLFMFVLNGVFGVNGVIMKSVMEGDSVTLHSHITDILIDDVILWMFGPKETPIAEINKKSIDMYNSNEIFRDKLQFNSQTGCLTITNITITNSGLYKLRIVVKEGTFYKRFNVTVYARQPAISHYCPQNPPSSKRSSNSKCVLLCSVLNVRDVSLSWYKGNSLLSSISVSDLNIRLFLPLEVDYQDTNTYSCVLNNTITNQTQHLNITPVCPQCSDFGQCFSFTETVIRLVLSALVGVATVAIVIYDIRSRRVE